MTDIELVIKIPENDFERLKKRIKFAPLDATYYEKTIANGTPLPKGHGRLIDASALLMDFAFANNKSAGECVHDAPTIIEADKESD